MVLQLLTSFTYCKLHPIFHFLPLRCVFAGCACVYTKGSLYLLDEGAETMLWKEVTQHDGDPRQGGFTAAADFLLKSPDLLLLLLFFFDLFSPQILPSWEYICICMSGLLSDP